MRVFVLSAPETCVNGASHGPIDVVVGRSVIFSSRARGTAPHRAFFMMGVSVDKWIRCGLPIGRARAESEWTADGTKEGTPDAVAHPSPLWGEGRVRGVFQGRRLDRRSDL